jgi:glycosyltransferase involved in cell wall biosynthesis
MRFSIIIPAYNEGDFVGDCLKSLTSSNFPKNEFEVIVVDNGSTDATTSIVQSFEDVSLYSFPEGKVGAVRNFGVQHSRGELLVFIDADCLVDTDWLATADLLAQNSPETVFGGGCILRSDPTWVETYWLLERQGQTALPKHLLGASIVIPRTLFELVGRFDEDISAGEDTALSEKIINEKIPMHIVSGLSVVHLGNARSLRSFFKRQIWHGSNYWKRFSKSKKDPVFLLICTFIVFLVSSFISIPINQSGSTFLFSITILTPLVLSGKRIYRSRPSVKFILLGLPQIYILDFLYVAGRIVGLLKSIFNK